MYLILCNTAFLSFFYFDVTDIVVYSLSLHDALPILSGFWLRSGSFALMRSNSTCALGHSSAGTSGPDIGLRSDRKSTRLNSSHVATSYAVFCLKKKKDTLMSSPSTTEK